VRNGWLREVDVSRAQLAAAFLAKPENGSHAQPEALGRLAKPIAEQSVVKSGPHVGIGEGLNGFEELSMETAPVGRRGDFREAGEIERENPAPLVPLVFVHGTGAGATAECPEPAPELVGALVPVRRAFGRQPVDQEARGFLNEVAASLFVAAAIYALCDDLSQLPPKHRVQDDMMHEDSPPRKDRLVAHRQIGAVKVH
jgi:hypothetical protein